MARPSMPSDHDVEALRRTFHERIRRDADAHRAMADRLGEAEERHREERLALETRIADLEAQNGALRSEVEGKDRELRTLLDTKTFRYSAAVRRLYGRLRGPR
jgi:hypothetical protein